MEIGIIALIVFVSLFAIWLIFYFIPVGLWFSALVSGVRISLLQLILMRWRKVPPSTIVSSMIESTKAGLELNPNELEAHYLAGGNVTNVVHALVSAQKANIMLDFKMATAIDLAGRDVFEAVQMSVNPKVINTPPVAAVAKDGIQLIAKARVTVRANIKQLVGGAGEETVLARVGEGIVSSIGSAQSHKIVLENPDSISRVSSARDEPHMDHSGRNYGEAGLGGYGADQLLRRSPPCNGACEGFAGAQGETALPGAVVP